MVGRIEGTRVTLVWFRCGKIGLSARKNVGVTYFSLVSGYIFILNFSTRGADGFRILLSNFVGNRI